MELDLDSLYTELINHLGKRATLCDILSIGPKYQRYIGSFARNIQRLIFPE